MSSGDEPRDPFDTPEGEALIKYVELDVLLDKWIKFHPEVTREQLDDAIERFREAIEKRDQRPPTD